MYISTQSRQARREAGPVVGGSSLLVIFAVLCLTVFALLALSTAQAGKRLADRSAQAVQDYYAADCAAEAVLARLRAGELPPGAEAGADGVYRYSCPISDSQVLEAEVQLEPGGGWRVLRWQAVPAQSWQPEDGLEVWDGELTALDEAPALWDGQLPA